MAHADREKTVSDPDLQKIVTAVRNPSEPDSPVFAPAITDFATTPAEKGYGHGV
jgi:hypothetical protein